MDEKKDCACSAAPKLIFACSGAVDVGAIADAAARKLAAEGKAKMFCTAGLGGRVAPIIKTTKAAEKIIAIDGCPTRPRTFLGGMPRRIMSLEPESQTLKNNPINPRHRTTPTSSRSGGGW